MTRAELIRRLADANPTIRVRDVTTAVEILFNEIAAGLARGDRVELRNFGIFTPRRRKAHIARNPRDPKADSGKLTPGCYVSLFVLQSPIVEEAIGPFATGDEISLKFPMNIHNHDNFFPVKLVSVSPNFTLGAIAMRSLYGFSSSGFQLCGPGDGKYQLNAIYPQLELPNKGSSLDYRPASQQ